MIPTDEVEPKIRYQSKITKHTKKRRHHKLSVEITNLDPLDFRK